MSEHHDILVAGAGIAGLTTACVLARSGLRVLCAEAAPEPVVDPSADGADLRTTACLMPSVRLLEQAGAWSEIASLVAPLDVMRIVDAGGRTRIARGYADFRASEIGSETFGYNVPNWLAKRALIAAARDIPGLSLRFEAAVTDFLARDDAAYLHLSDGSAHRATLALAADGRDSGLRALSGLPIRRWDYGQKAHVFAVTHKLPHERISTEIHSTGGPFTLVPMPDSDGENRSSVVWMTPSARAAELQRMTNDAFTSAVQAESLGVMGELQLASRRAVWPVIGQIAPRLHGRRLALMAEAAHVVPPIGAQGFNMSLADLAVLREEITRASEAGEDLGLAVPERYHRRRIADIAMRVAGVDVLNRFAKTEIGPLRDLRYAGLRALHALVPVRRGAMRLGLGG